MADGFSDHRLARIEPVLRRYVDDGELPGYLLLISRRGREALFLAGGLMDVERGRRFERDAIVRIYSMTKPVASVALMQLYERGGFQLDDPVSRYLRAGSACRCSRTAVRTTAGRASRTDR